MAKIAKSTIEQPVEKAVSVEDSEVEVMANEDDDKEEEEDLQKSEDSVMQLEQTFIAAQINKDDLDYISTTIIKNLSKYLAKEDITVKEMCKDIIFNKAAKVGTEQQEVEVMKSKDFFAKLWEVDVLPYTEGTKPMDIHKDLELVFSAEKYPDIIIVKKVEEAVNSFTADLDDSGDMFKQMAEAVATVNENNPNKYNANNEEKEEEYGEDFGSEHDSAEKPASKLWLQRIDKSESIDPIDDQPKTIPLDDKSDEDEIEI